MTRDDDELPGDLQVELVAPPAPPPVTVLEGALRTSGRPYVAPSPPDELHVMWPLIAPPMRWAVAAATMLGLFTLVGSVGGLAAAAAALPLVYLSATIALGRSRLVINRKHLRLSHGPLPIWFTRTVPIASITAVNVTNSNPAPRDPSASGDKWRVVVRAGDQRFQILGTHLSAEAYALQGLIERRIGLILPGPPIEPAALPDPEPEPGP